MSLREYKSSVFSMLLENPEYALDTYNALNESNYEEPGLVTIQKLEGKIILSVRNDASFLFDAYLNLYEHQSTYNPNMPLRFLLYYTDLIRDMVEEQKLNLYGKRNIPIPTPKFVVLYNGTEKQPAVEEYRLSDAFEHKEKTYELELTCVMYNINPGYNDEMLKRSKVLLGYTTFVEKVRRYGRQFKELRDAVNQAMDECIAEGILEEFFTGRRQEVLDVAALDFTFERQLELTARDSREDGIEIGRADGIKIGHARGIVSMGKDFGLAKEAILEKLMEKLGIDENQAEDMYNRISGNCLTER